MENQILDATEHTTHAGYAGFWLRVAAAIIDGIIIMVIFAIIMVSLKMSMIGEPTGEYSDLTGIQITGAAFMVLSYIAIPWLYHALQESSDTQASLGKKIVGIKVTNMHGHPISFLNATGRHFGKIVSGLIIYIGFIMAGFTEKKQALHDMMASCLVVKK